MSTRGSHQGANPYTLDMADGGPAGPIGYRPALDGLRAVAIVLVLWHHTRIALVPPRYSHVAGGFLGVDVFFVLSGFLITNLLLERRERTGAIALWPFYRRRAVRLLPALLGFLAVDTLVAWVAGWDMGDQVRTVLAALFYVTNWAPTFHWELARDHVHLWTLAVEEQFYLGWPLALGLLVRLRSTLRAPAIAVAVLGVGAWRLLLAVRYESVYPELYQRTDTRIDALLVGAGLAVLFQHGWRPTKGVAAGAGLAGAAIVLFAVGNPAAFDPLFLYYGGFTFVAVGTAGVILAALEDGSIVQRWLARPAAVLLGRASYSLYLWHVLVLVLVRDHVGGPTVLRIAVAWAASVAVAGASFALLERPVLAGGRRSWRPSLPSLRGEREGPRAGRPRLRA